MCCSVTSISLFPDAQTLIERGDFYYPDIAHTRTYVCRLVAASESRRSDDIRRNHSDSIVCELRVSARPRSTSSTKKAGGEEIPFYYEQIKI